LVGAELEVRQLGTRYRDVAVRVIDEGVPPLAIEDLKGFASLHFATHVRTNDESPWQSAIQIYPPDDPANLRASEIAEVRLDAKLAVLSSCNSAGGRVLSGEGVLGLSSAFIGAGVPAVLATLWAVEDRATERFVDHFYSSLAEGATVTTALYAARKKLRSEPETAHPFFWSGFVLIGDGDIRLSLEEKRGRFPIIPTGLGLVALAICFWIWVRRPSRPFGH
jgi:hypothetical protein